MNEATLRPAVAADLPAIYALVRELAVFEKLEHELIATEADFHRHLFGSHPAAEVIVAERADRPARSDAGGGGERDPKIVGLALFFRTFSTFNGQPGVWLEDLIVRESCRGQGIGRQLITRLAQLTVERGYRRLEWAVLDWNIKAIQFYRSLGAHPQADWTTYRLTGPALVALGTAATNQG